MRHYFIIVINKFLAKLAYITPGGNTIRPFFHKLRGVEIGRNVWISQYVYIDELHPETIQIGDNSSVGMRTSIINHFYWGPRRNDNPSKVVIENDVCIAPYCVILPSVTIGSGSVVQVGRY